MKKLSALMLALFIAMLAVPVFADSGDEQVKNLKTGGQNVSAGWVEVPDSIHAEAAKGKNEGEQIVGLAAGTAIGVRKTIHRMGAGVIDVLTFWIPKKQPLVNPDTARLT